MSLQTKSGRPLFPIGIGTWDIGSMVDLDPSAKYKAQAVHGHEAPEIEALRYSVDKGQNHFDCAELYGAFYTDEIVGRAIVGYEREALFIADKLWKSSVGPGQVRPTVEQMFKKLGVDYLDLLYIHAPWPDVDWQAAIPQIDELIDAGLVRYFGVSNFTIEQMRATQAQARHPIAANQMNFNVLYKDEVPQAFRDYCRQHDIQLVAYQPVKRKGVLSDSTVQTIATAHQVTPAQVALAWLLRVDALPIPKATTKAHIDENLQAVNLRLTAADMAQLESL
jgi:2,5-diketo-D-gluconate reductase B